MFIAFIDESGDPGFDFAKGASEHFVMAMVGFETKEHTNTAIGVMENLKSRFRVKEEFKFSGSTAFLRQSFFETIARLDFTVSATVVHKKLLSVPIPNFYKYTLRCLLDASQVQEANIILDGKNSKNLTNKLKSYLKKECLYPIQQLRLKDSRKDSLLQLADMVAGAIMRTYSRQDATYFDLIRPKIKILLEVK
jgi:hypothetical protein